MSPHVVIARIRHVITCMSGITGCVVCACIIEDPNSVVHIVVVFLDRECMFVVFKSQSFDNADPKRFDVHVRPNRKRYPLRYPRYV